MTAYIDKKFAPLEDHIDEMLNVARGNTSPWLLHGIYGPVVGILLVQMLAPAWAFSPLLCIVLAFASLTSFWFCGGHSEDEEAVGAYLDAVGLHTITARFEELEWQSAIMPELLEEIEDAYAEDAYLACMHLILALYNNTRRVAEESTE